MKSTSQQTGVSDAAVNERILTALLSGNRARAMLFHMRQHGGTPEQAWQFIRDLVEIRKYEKASQDPHVHRLERYLDGRGDFKGNLAFALLTIGAVVLGTWIVSNNWSRMTAGIDSYWWPKTSGIVTASRYYGHSHWSRGRKVTHHFVDYSYRYTIDGRTYSKSIKDQSWVDMFDGERLRRGDAIRVMYNAEKPGQAIHIRDMYQRLLPVVVGFCILLPATGMLLLIVFFEITHRDLERVDPARGPAQDRGSDKDRVCLAPVGVGRVTA